MTTIRSLVRPTIGVSIGIWRADQVLIVRRGRPPLQDLWSFPGGRLEPGERLAEAALREACEETGVAAEIAGFTDLVEILTHAAEGHLTHHVVLALFAARWVAGEPLAGDDAAEACFVTLDDLARRETTAGLLGYARATRAKLGG
jgi:8-oxo-dGTP diphosphatase